MRWPAGGNMWSAREGSWETWESLWVAGARRGAAFRAFDGRILTTRIAFDDGVGAPFAAETLLSLSDSGETWAAFRHRQEPGGVRSAVRRDAMGLDVDTLPVGGEYLLLNQLIRSHRESATFRRVDVARPGDEPAPAEIRRRGEATVDLPEGRTVCAERFDVVAGGLRVAAHWQSDGVVLRSSFSGALLFACPREAEALAGLNGRMGDFLRRGYAER
ncbi:MAG: hypothetical protein HOQ07_13815 [Sinomonas sp.]|nr:hypothetical protein [Sinomonas sp.]